MARFFNTSGPCEPPLLAGEYLEGDVMDDDIQFTEDLGLVVSGEMGLEIANPIYREIVPRVTGSALPAAP